MALMAAQRIAILGSTGSVGRSTLDVIAALPDRFHVVGLAAGSNAALLQKQIDRFGPRYACLTHARNARISNARIIRSRDPLVDLATLDEVDIVVIATTGHAAIPATIAALEAGKVVALANKETIVAAGAIVMPLARHNPGKLRPVDSEHSAIWQCLPGGRFDASSVHKILLTASGGPFRGWTIDELRTVSVEQALEHPNWTMGARITIDSATLMNKGFELIEAAWLFDCPIESIEIVVHPQSIVHSMVEYADGGILAQLASHDMRLPIQYALTFPDRLEGPGERLSLADLTRLEFEPPDYSAFPAPLLARQAAQAGGTYPAVLSTADELAVRAFLKGRVPLTWIPSIVERALDAHVPDSGAFTLDAIDTADRWTSAFVEDLMRSGTLA
jgi:1-deoxy-D-xylulose-5-phosphate reductoisomerase